MNRLSNYRKNIPIFLVVVFAAVLRLYRIRDFLTFLGDEGRDVLIVRHIVMGFGYLFQGNIQEASKNLTLLGPTASVGGFFLGPIYYYFMAPFLWLFNYDPVGPAIMIAILGTITVWVIYKITKEFFDTKTAVVAATLYTISPVVINYSRSSWNPNPMPFFSLLTLYLLYKAFHKKKILLIFVSGILFGIAMQLHYLSVFLGAIITFYIAVQTYYQKDLLITVQRTLLLIQNYLTFFAGFILGWSLFLAFEIRHGFKNIISIYNFVFHSNDTGGSSHFLYNIWDVLFRIFARLVFHFPEVKSYPITNPIFILFYICVSFFILLSITLLGYHTYRSFREKKENFRVYSLLILWLLIGVVLFGFYKKPIYDYYFEFIFPLPFILTAFTIVHFYSYIPALLHRMGKHITESKKEDMYYWGQQISIIIFLALIFWNLFEMPFTYTPNKQLDQTERIARFVYDKAKGKPFNFALITSGNSDYAYRYLFEVWGNTPVTIENAVVDPPRNTVTDQLFIVCESLPCHPLGDSLWEIAGFGRGDIAGQWNVPPVQIFKFVHYQGMK